MLSQLLTQIGPELKKNFGFKPTQIPALTIDKIIDDTFSNPERSTISRNRDWVFDRATGLSAKGLKEKVIREIPQYREEFNSKRINLLDYSQVVFHHEEFNLVDWFTRLRNVKWYGPFKQNQREKFAFATALPDGRFHGLKVTIDFFTYSDRV